MHRGAGAKPLAAEGGGNPALARRARVQIAEYLEGRRTSFDLPLDLSGLTPFVRGVLRAAARIPYGETRSYAWVAREAGRPRAFRAVGQAMGRNPVPLVVP
jgi:O6-methylguanine-DNA--protein-cysteine methyltransferase